MHNDILSRGCVFLYSKEKRPLEEILDIGATHFLTDKNKKANNNSATDLDDLANASDTTCGSTSTNISTQLWHGFVGISLRNRPQAAMLGWTLGYQPVLFEYAPPGRSPDIPICSEERGRMAGIHRHHITIGCIRGTGILGMMMVKGEARVKCDALPVTKWTRKPFTDPMHLIEFGTLQYWMVYVQVQGTVDDARQRELKDFLDSIPRGQPFIRSATATPTDNDLIVGMWRILGEAGRGGSNIMAAAIHRASGTVAISRHRQEGASDYSHFRKELYMEKSITEKLSATRFGLYHVQKLLETRSYDNNLYAFYAPLCPWDLATLLRREDYSDLERQALFTQLLLAIRDLHAIQRIHSDIKPTNICVQSRVPLCLVLVDTASIQECPTDGLRCTPGVGGTVGYLAPEREASSTYGKPVDVWAAGCVGVEMLLRKSDFTARYFSILNVQGKPCNPWRPLHTFEKAKAPHAADVEKAKSSFHLFRDHLVHHADGSKEQLLHMMLEPDPRKRVTARDAVNHPFAREAYELASEASDEPQPGCKRKASNR